MTAREAVVDVGRGIELCYQQTGDPAEPPIVLIAGLGQQLHSWPDDFAHALAGRGYRVTRFDNRDAGRSTHMNFPPPNPVAIHPTGGAATARAIPRARLATIEGLGHDLPIGSWIRIIDLITDHTSWAPVTHTKVEEQA